MLRLHATSSGALPGQCYAMSSCGQYDLAVLTGRDGNITMAVCLVLLRFACEQRQQQDARLPLHRACVQLQKGTLLQKASMKLTNGEVLIQTVGQFWKGCQLPMLIRVATYN